MSSLLLTLDAFREAAPTAADWRALLPEILVAALAVIALLQALILPRAGRILIPTVARLGLVAALVLVAVQPHDPSVVLFNGLLATTSFTPEWRMLFLICALLTSLIGSRFFQAREADEAEFHHLLLLVTVALMVLAQAAHVTTFFVALETATVGLYILIGFLRKSSASLEAGVKYLVAGGLSSALLLLGFVLLQGVAGLVNPAGSDPLAFTAIAQALTQTSTGPLVLTGAALVLVGVGFKLGAFPFHGWVPDVYQGAPTPITALLATASKAAGAVGLVLLLTGPLASLAAQLVPVLTLLAAGSLLAGNLGALGSSDTKRALALSGVSHAGFLLAVIAALTGVATRDGWDELASELHLAVLVYLFAYTLGTFATLGALAEVPNTDDHHRPLRGLRGLMRRGRSLTASLTLGIGSLAGIPPSVGFFAKLYILWVLARAEMYGLLGLGIVSVAISIYYYFAIIREAVSRPSDNAESLPITSTWIARAVPLGLAALTLILGMLTLLQGVGGGE